MAKDPSMPFYVNDWLSSSKIACMSLEQQGAYVRLLCYCWASQSAAIPDDDSVLAKLSGMNEGWLNGGSLLVRDCFEPHPNKTGFLTNKRLLELWKEREQWREKSAEAGRKSGESRRKSRDEHKIQKNGHIEPTFENGSSQMRTKCEPNTNSSSSSSSSSSLKDLSHTREAMKSLESPGDRLTFLARQRSETFEQFIAAYPRKASADAAWEVWQARVFKIAEESQKSCEDVESFLIAAAREYAASPAGQPPSQGNDFRPAPAKWLLDGRYSDSREEWQQPNGKQPAKKQTAKPTPKVQEIDRTADELFARMNGLMK